MGYERAIMIGDIDGNNIRSDIDVEKSCFPEGHDLEILSFPHL